MKKAVVVLVAVILTGCANLSLKERAIAVEGVSQARLQNEATASDVREFLELNIKDIRMMAPVYAESLGLPPEDADATVEVHEKSKRRIETSLQALERGSDQLRAVTILLGGAINNGT